MGGGWEEGGGGPRALPVYCRVSSSSNEKRSFLSFSAKYATSQWASERPAYASTSSISAWAAANERSRRSPSSARAPSSVAIFLERLTSAYEP